LLPFFECYNLRTWMSYLGHYDLMTHSRFNTWCHNKISKACWSSKTFDLQTFFHEMHLIHMTTSEESLRVLFLTSSLAIDLVHYTDVSRGLPQQIQVD
jgi:hypothetical protein